MTTAVTRVVLLSDLARAVIGRGLAKAPSSASEHLPGSLPRASIECMGEEGRSWVSNRHIRKYGGRIVLTTAVRPEGESLLEPLVPAPTSTSTATRVDLTIFGGQKYRRSGARRTGGASRLEDVRVRPTVVRTVYPPLCTRYGLEKAPCFALEAR